MVSPEFPCNSVSARRTAVLVIVVIAGAAALALWTHRPPLPLPDTAPVTEFSAMRAVQHIEAFATEPHRSGTEANYRVQDYIVATMKAMGASPLVSNVPLMLHKGWPEKRFPGSLLGHPKLSSQGVVMTNPENILVRLPGTASTKAFLMMAHYDSVPFGPGACDDGAGVATLIEAYRALKAGPPPKE